MGALKKLQLGRKLKKEAQAKRGKEEEVPDEVVKNPARESQVGEIFQEPCKMDQSWCGGRQQDGRP